MSAVERRYHDKWLEQKNMFLQIIRDLLFETNVNIHRFLLTFVVIAFISHLDNR
jgi:hypothetical protein